jgi:hypothetical protein
LFWKSCFFSGLPSSGAADRRIVESGELTANEIADIQAYFSQKLHGQFKGLGFSFSGAEKLKDLTCIKKSGGNWEIAANTPLHLAEAIEVLRRAAPGHGGMTTVTMRGNTRA